MILIHDTYFELSLEHFLDKMDATLSRIIRSGENLWRWRRIVRPVLRDVGVNFWLQLGKKNRCKNN
jgi:hypothetical protein